MRRRIRATSRRRNPVEVLVSGGMDSAALLAYYARQDFDVRAVFVNFGQPAAKQEVKAATSLSKHYRVPLSIFRSRCDATFSAGEISGRNAFLLFAAILARQGRSGMIAVGIHEGPPYYDCTEGFLNAVQVIVNGYAAGCIRVAAPFLKWNKRMIWDFCKKYGVPVHLTYSC